MGIGANGGCTFTGVGVMGGGGSIGGGSTDGGRTITIGAPPGNFGGTNGDSGIAIDADGITWFLTPQSRQSCRP